MPILGIVVTFHAHSLAAGVRKLASIPGLQLGTPQANQRIPAVLSSESRAVERTVWQQVENMPEVALLEVVFADFSDVVPDGTPSPSASLSAQVSTP